MRHMRGPRVAAAIVVAGVCLTVGGCAFPGGPPGTGSAASPTGATRTAASGPSRPPVLAGTGAPPASVPFVRPPARTVPPPVAARSGVDFADPAAVAAAFAEVYLSYRWDQDQAWWRRELARFATEAWIRDLPAPGAARESAGWRMFVATRGTVTARVDHAAVVPAAPGGPGVVFVQVSAWQLTARDGEVDRADEAPISVELHRANDGVWRVARAWSL